MHNRINISKPELVQTTIDYISEIYGERCLDKMDVEQLAENCFITMHESMELMLEEASNQAKKIKRRTTNSK